MYRTRAMVRMGVPASMQYRLSGQSLQAGDFLGIGKALKKIKLKNVLPLASFIPGVGPLIAKAGAVLTNPQKRYQAELDFARGLPGGAQAVQALGFGTNPYTSAPVDFRGVVGGSSTTAPGGLPQLRRPSRRETMSAASMGGGRRRRRTVVDITAVRHAMARLERFEKVARKVVHFTHPTRHGATVARFKSKGRR